MTKFLTLKPEEEPLYREKAMEFIHLAQAGDVEQMLQITSPLSRATETNSMRILYAGQVIPQFQGTTVTWEPRSETEIDEQNYPFLIFSGTARGTKKFSFSVAVEKENGKLVVINIQKRR